MEMDFCKIRLPSIRENTEQYLMIYFQNNFIVFGLQYKYKLNILEHILG